MTSKQERDYQAYLIQKLKRMFRGCMVLKNDSGYIQGIPDLTVLYKNKWAVLEVKAAFDSEEQPNQDYYVSELNKMSFGAFIYPENEEEVLNALQAAFSSARQARVPKREHIPLDSLRR